MNSTVKKILAAIALACLTIGCNNLATHQSPILTEKLFPAHKGSGQSGSIGVYNYTAYAESVVFKAASSVIITVQAIVYDMDHDGTFDTVFLLKEGTWQFASTITSEQMHPNTAAPADVRKFFLLANKAKALNKITQLPVLSKPAWADKVYSPAPFR